MAIKMDVYSTASAFSEDEIRGKTVVVIDVLRASSTIITAIQNGAKGVLPVADSGVAGRIAQTLDSSSYLLCGERDGHPIEGYALGNSPREYSREVVENYTLIYTTTNGTRAITRCENAEKVIIAGFINAKAVVQHIKKSEKEVILICAGWKNRLSIEDLLCAGRIISEVYNGKLPEKATDGVSVAYGLYKMYGKNIVESVLASNHALRLKEMGFADDVLYCCQQDIVNRVPVIQEGIIT